MIFQDLVMTLSYTRRTESEEDITEITFNVEEVTQFSVPALILRKHVCPSVFHLVSYKNALVKLHQAFVSCLTVLYILVMFQLSGNSRTSHPSTKKIVKNRRDTTDQHLCCQLLAKF